MGKGWGRPRGRNTAHKRSNMQTTREVQQVAESGGGGSHFTNHVDPIMEVGTLDISEAYKLRSMYVFGAKYQAHHPSKRHKQRTSSHTHTHTRGYHKVCTPVPAHRKRTLPMQSLLPHKKPCLQRPARHSSGLLRSPHQPPTPPAPKRRRPKTPPPPSPPAPVPQGLEGDEAEDAVARPLFLSRHGRASTSVT